MAESAQNNSRATDGLAARHPDSDEYAHAFRLPESAFNRLASQKKETD
jgi:hypothetical protein